MELSPRVSRNRGAYKKLNIYTVIASIVAAIIVICLIFTVWFTAIIIEDKGMEPTLERGDTVLCDKLSLAFRSPKRGDMLCYRAAYGKEVYISRVVGLGGEEVAIKNGQIYINGCLLSEDYIDESCAADMESTLVPQGSFLLLPDGRSSIDSFEPEELIINAGRVVGRLAVRVAPVGRISIFE